MLVTVEVKLDSMLRPESMKECVSLYKAIMVGSWKKHAASISEEEEQPISKPSTVNKDEIMKVIKNDIKDNVDDGDNEDGDEEATTAKAKGY
ncbi:predicted protein [Lichtheimia corymbifera JMRC:FSU:9682]|uniref:Uncharacterized protein n=1 Tax=Lichtheimia corymbifera JMRC:FSU:9682 TaxID=1263082 RepID=A0A068RSU6_9FUNG|nr:predicted protein [Lichtheimia corymbifera JMRC:FSU:9682]